MCWIILLVIIILVFGTFFLLPLTVQYIILKVLGVILKVILGLLIFGIVLLVVVAVPVLILTAVLSLF